MHTLWDAVEVQEADMISAHGSLAVTQVMPSESDSCTSLAF